MLANDQNTKVNVDKSLLLNADCSYNSQADIMGFFWLDLDVMSWCINDNIYDCLVFPPAPEHGLSILVALVIINN